MPERITVTAMISLWQEAFGQWPITDDDNFFDLGGHSLTAAQIVTRLETETGIRLPPLTVFDHPTPSELTEILNKDDGSRRAAN